MPSLASTKIFALTALLLFALYPFTMAFPTVDRTLGQESDRAPVHDSDHTIENSDNTWEIFNTTISERSTSHGLVRRETTINLEPGVDFQDCLVNINTPGMCGVSFVEHSSWGSYAVIFIFDPQCNRIGANTHISRDVLATPGGWGMSSVLPKYLVLQIPRTWNQDQPDDVILNYDYHRFRPFQCSSSPYGALYSTTYRIPSAIPTNGQEGSYTVFRAGFPC